MKTTTKAAEVLRLSRSAAAGYTGWILLDGSRLPCAHGEHLDVAFARGEAHPDARGWVHCDAGRLDPLANEPTPAQVRTMTDIVVSRGETLPEWVLGWL